jgi:hypothetical protein
MKKSYRFLLIGLCLAVVGCQYGPKRDYSKFKSAALIEDGSTVAFTFHAFEYRPATGIAAFPDGGIPKYLTDRSFLCTLNRATGDLKKLMDEKNRQWSHGSGVLHIVTARGNTILASQSGQKRRDLSSYLTLHHLLNVTSGAHETFDLAEDLRKHGRKKGAIYLVDDDGTLLIMTLSYSTEAKPKSSPKEIPEVWVRNPGGRYFIAAATAHYQQTVHGEVIYWNPDDRKYYGFNIEAGTTSLLEGYRIPESQQVVEGVSIGARGASLEFGVRTNGVWQYKPLPVDAAAVRDL